MGDFDGFEALSFDCYGTLIDWERGAAAVVAVRAGDLDAEQAEPPPGSEGWQDVARFRKGLAKLAARD